MTEYDVRSLYLDLIRRNLTRYGMPERIPEQWSLRQRALFKAGNRMLRRTNAQRLAGTTLRDLGLDWPAEAETMIGMKRLLSLQQCVESAPALKQSRVDAASPASRSSQ